MRTPEPISKEPDRAGLHGKAWLIDIEAARAKIVPPQIDGSVASWIIEAPWAHPIWHSYVLHLMHLRSLEGFDAPKILKPGATHEFHLLALDPDQPRQPCITADAPVCVLWPANFAAQLVYDSDEAAAQRMAETVRMICDGELSPDTDFRYAWTRMFGDEMLSERGSAPVH